MTNTHGKSRHSLTSPRENTPPTAHPRPSQQKSDKCESQENEPDPLGMCEGKNNSKKGSPFYCIGSKGLSSHSLIVVFFNGHFRFCCFEIDILIGCRVYLGKKV